MTTRGITAPTRLMGDGMNVSPTDTVVLPHRLCVKPCEAVETGLGSGWYVSDEFSPENSKETIYVGAVVTATTIYTCSHLLCVNFFFN